MAGQSRFLTESYGAYWQAVLPPVDDVLTRVGPDTPGGEYLRRFWHPVIHSETLGDLPIAIRILGEDLIVFRDGSGQVGLLERHCSHRGTSLEFGQIAERGIKCCYHGWHFDIDGAVLEAPAEPDGNPYEGKLYQGAYPTIEYHGLVFAYMGPPDKKPSFPIYDSFEDPETTLGLGEVHTFAATLQPCNWLQMMDNTPDQAHEAFLHARSSGLQFLDRDRRPIEEVAILGEIDWWETPIGIACHEARRLGEDVWVRSMEYICPTAVQVCSVPLLPPHYGGGESEIVAGPHLIRWKVPVDDTHTLNYSFIFYGPDEEQTYVSNPAPATRALYGNRPYEERQRFPGDYDAQVGQRPIAIHAAEHLGTADRGVAMLRKMLREGIEAVAQGEDPKGIDRVANGTVPTYSRETIMRVAPAPSGEEEEALLHRLSREVFDRAVAASGRERN